MAIKIMTKSNGRGQRLKMECTLLIGRGRRQDIPVTGSASDGTALTHAHKPTPARSSITFLCVVHERIFVHFIGRKIFEFAKLKWR